MVEVAVVRQAIKDLASLPPEVEETFYSKKEAVQKNLDLGADPESAFDKYMSGNMHPILQMTLGRDYRAWFLEGEYLDELEDGKIYCIKVIKKTEAKKLTGRIRNVLEYASRVL